MDDPVRRLKMIGRDLNDIEIECIPDDLERVCFICVNTYTSYRLNLGVIPINDAVNWAKCMARYEYQVFFLHNPHSRNFLDYLDILFKKVTKHLVFYYVGHGISFECTLGYDESTYNKAMVFDDGSISDGQLIQDLISYKNPQSVITLITDSCRAGTIWDMQSHDLNGKTLPPNIMTISASSGTQTDRQTALLSEEHGVFTHNITKLLKLNPNLTPNELESKMKAILKAYKQTILIGTTSIELKDQPIFIKEEIIDDDDDEY